MSIYGQTTITNVNVLFKRVLSKFVFLFPPYVSHSDPRGWGMGLVWCSRDNRLGLELILGAGVRGNIKLAHTKAHVPFALTLPRPLQAARHILNTTVEGETGVQNSSSIN